MTVTLDKTYRYELTIYGPSGRPCGESFTWGTSYANAYARVAQELDENDRIWAGHSFKLNKTPTLSIPTNKIPRG